MPISSSGCLLDHALLPQLLAYQASKQVSRHDEAFHLNINVDEVYERLEVTIPTQQRLCVNFDFNDPASR
jgi:hypothetical protein